MVIGNTNRFIISLSLVSYNIGKTKISSKFTECLISEEYVRLLYNVFASCDLNNFIKTWILNVREKCLILWLSYWTMISVRKPAIFSKMISLIFPIKFLFKNALEKKICMHNTLIRY